MKLAKMTTEIKTQILKHLLLLLLIGLGSDERKNEKKEHEKQPHAIFRWRRLGRKKQRYANETNNRKIIDANSPAVGHGSMQPLSGPGTNGSQKIKICDESQTHNGYHYFNFTCNEIEDYSMDLQLIVCLPFCWFFGIVYQHL